MNRSLAASIALITVLVAACGSPAPTTSIAAQPTTTATEPITTSTTAAPETSTTAAPATTQATTTTRGSVESSAELDALHTAFAASAAITSGRMEGLIEMTGLDPSATGLTELSMPFGGAFDNVTGDFSFYLDMSGLAAAAGEEMPPELADLFGEMEVRQIGDRAYMRFAFLNMFLGAETEWIAMPADESGTATQDFAMSSPSNPSEFLGTFEDAGATVDAVGVETVNGVQATHYRAVFDTEALLASATPEERAQLEAQGPLPADFLPLDVWVSDEGLVVRFVIEIDGTGLAATPEESFDTMTMRYDLLDLNGDVAIEAPPAADTTDIEDLDGFSF